MFRTVDVADDLWDETAHFIASARQDIPCLIAETRCQEPGEDSRADQSSN